jgi:predicted kinase
MTAEITMDSTVALSHELSHLSLLELPVSLSAISLPFGSNPFDHYSYNWERSTEENFRSNDTNFYGSFKEFRHRLDYKYHAYYSASRQLVQDQIIDSLLLDDTAEQDGNDKLWIIFTAGVMGAGKTHTVRELDSNGQLALKSFVSVDPDEIRRLLPEFGMYVENNAENAGINTRKEAGMIAEILTEVALKRGQSVLVDGSLRDAAWYQNYFQTLRVKYPALKLGIIHVTAPIDKIFERVKVRIMSCNRKFPSNFICTIHSFCV